MNVHKTYVETRCMKVAGRTTKKVPNSCESDSMRDVTSVSTTYVETCCMKNVQTIRKMDIEKCCT